MDDLPKIDKLTLEQLIQLKGDIDTRLSLIIEEKEKEIREIRKSLVFNSKKTPSSESEKLPPKYRSKNEPSRLWVGRGPQPKWMQEEIKEGLGKNKEDFLLPEYVNEKKEA